MGNSQETCILWTMSRVGSFEIKEGDNSVEDREIDNLSLGTRVSVPPPPTAERHLLMKSWECGYTDPDRVGVTWGNLGETESGIDSTSCKREVIGPMAPAGRKWTLSLGHLERVLPCRWWGCRLGRSGGFNADLECLIPWPPLLCLCPHSVRCL